MQTKQHIKLFSFMLFSMLMVASNMKAEEQDNSFSDLMDSGQTRACLPVPNSVKMKACDSFTKLVSPGDIGGSTANLACCKVFQLTGSKTYSTSDTSNPANPLFRMSGKGATLDLCHNCVTLSKKTGLCSEANEHAVAIELGYSPNGLGANTQPDTLTVENGIICGWDIGIMVHAGVRNVTLRNLVLTKCTLPIAMIGTRDDTLNSGLPEDEVCTVHLENITIIGDNTERLDCLKWIRAKLTDGTAKDGGAAATNFYGYDDLGANNPEVQLKECDPITDAADTLYVYSGIYAHAVANMSLKNVSVSNVGYDGDTADSGGDANTSEATAAYGMYFRHCNGVIMEDVESTKNKSGRTAVGMYFDNCCMVSAKNSNISGNSVTQVGTEVVGAQTNCPAGRWAAAVALKDTNVYELCDAVLSKTFGLETSYGVRTIFNPVDSVNSLGFENVTADMLRGDAVVGFDFGDSVQFNMSPSTEVKSVQKLRMKNISVSSARGKNVSTETDFPDNTVTSFFVGIHLGDASATVFSKDIVLDEISIQSNKIGTGSADPSSGIEFGDGGGDAETKLVNARFKNLSITGNSGGGNSNDLRFVAIRGYSDTGTFENLAIENAYLGGNEYSGIYIKGSVLNNVTMDGVHVGGNTAGDGVDLACGTINSVTVLNSRFVNSAINGFRLGVNSGPEIKSVAFKNCYFLNNGGTGLNFEAATLIDNIKLQDICVSNNDSADAGVHFQGATKDVLIERADISNHAGTGADGLRFALTLNNLKMVDVCMSNNSAEGLSIVGVASSVTAVNGQFNNNGAAGLNFAALTGLTLENVVANNNTTTGLLSTGAESVSCTNCQFSDNGGSGLSLGAANGVNLIDTVANKNTANGLTTSGINGLSATRCQFSQNIIGLSLGTAAGVTLDHVVANKNTSFGVSATAQGFSATSSQFNQNGTAVTDHGLSLGTATGVTLDHVTANDNAGAGVSATANGFGATTSEFNQNGSHGLDLGAATGVDLNDVSGLDNAGSGLALGGGQGVSCKCCRFDHNAEGITAGAVEGLYLKDTTANHNGVGLGMTTAKGVSCDGCQFNSNATIGINASDAIDNVKILNSSVDNNGSGAGDFGFSAGSTANSLVFKNSTFNHNFAAGFTATGLVNSMSLDHVTFNENGTGVQFTAGLDNGTWNDVQANHNAQKGIIASGGAIKNFVGTNISADFNNSNGFDLRDAEHFSLDGFSANGHSVGDANDAGIKAGNVEHMVLKNGFVNNNTKHGIWLDSANGLLMEHVTVNGTTAATAVDVYGIRIGNGAAPDHAKNVHLKDVEVSHTHAGDATVTGVTGIWMRNLRDGNFENVIVSNTDASLVTSGDANGIYIEPESDTEYAVQGWTLNNVIVRETKSSDNAYNVQIFGGGYGIHAHDINFSGATNTDNTLRAIGWLMEVKDVASAKAFESVYVDGFHCDDQKGGAVGGIVVRAAGNTSLDIGTRLLTNAEFKNGTADNNIGAQPEAGVLSAVGILLDENPRATQVGPCDVLFENVSVSKNVMTGDDDAIGLLIKHGETITCKGVKANNNRTEGGATAAAYGMNFNAIDGTSTTNLTIEDSTANYNVSSGAGTGDLYGIRIDNGESVTLKNVVANYNQTAAGANVYGIGMTITNDPVDIITTDNVTILDTVCSGNKTQATAGNATGLYLDKAHVLQVDGLIANDNLGGDEGVVRGIHFAAQGVTTISNDTQATVGCQLNNMQACGNEAGKRAYGIEIFRPTGVHMQHIDASSNKSTGTAIAATLYQAAGLFLQGGCSVTIEDIHANVNEEAATNEAVMVRDLQAAKAVDGGGAGLESLVNDTVHVSRHFPVAHRCGAYGILADGTADLSIDGGTACKNKGVRSFGVMVRGSTNPDDFAALDPQYKVKNPVIKNLDASENHAIGGVWWNADPFQGLTESAVAIPLNQQDTIFGGATGTVDLGQAYEQYLKSLNQFNNSLEETGNNSFSLCGDTNDNPTMGSASCVASTLEIIWSTIAQFRRFSTAVGIGIYNADCATVDSCRAMGNHSEKDGAAGIAIYGCCNNRGHLVQNNVTACNEGWSDSRRGGTKFDIDGQIDITEWSRLYDNTFLPVQEITAGAAPPYTVAAIPVVIPAATPGDPLRFKPDLTQTVGTSEWTLNNRKLSVTFDATNGPAYDFATVAPLTAGILLEGQRDSNVLNNNSYTNTGNAGLAFGIASDATSSSMFSDNKATSNEADAAGFALGLADISYSTANIWYRNWMYANRVDVFMNSSLMIVFDTIASGSQALPVQTIYQGNIDALLRSLQLDNIIVKFVNCRQIKDCIGDCVRHKLGDGTNFIPATAILSADNEVNFAGCTACA